jgi:hypothetical protein
MIRSEAGIDAPRDRDILMPQILGYLVLGNASTKSRSRGQATIQTLL